MTRPIGVVVVAMLLMFTGVLKVLIGLEAAGITSFGLAPVMPNADLIASTATIAGLFTLIAAFGLFTMQTWAWYLAIVILAIRVTADVLGLISYAATSVFGGVTILNLVITAVALWYFLRPHVKEAYGVGPMNPA